MQVGASGKVVSHSHDAAAITKKKIRERRRKGKDKEVERQERGCGAWVSGRGDSG